MERKISLAAGLLAACLACGCGEGNSISPGGLAQDRATQGSESRRVHEDFQQLLPRGGIPAIDDPKYVSADQAKISDDAFVFGVVIEGQPFAYSLNLLNGHEVVNDTFGKTNFAAVW